MMLALVPLQQIVFRCSYRQNRCLEPIPMESPDFSLIPIETRNTPPPPSKSRHEVTLEPELYGNSDVCLDTPKSSGKRGADARSVYSSK